MGSRSSKATKAAETLVSGAAAAEAAAKAVRAAWGTEEDKRGACKSRAGLGLASNSFWGPRSLGAVAALVGWLGITPRRLGAVKSARVPAVRSSSAGLMREGLLALDAAVWRCSSLLSFWGFSRGVVVPRGLRGGVNGVAACPGSDAAAWGHALPVWLCEEGNQAVRRWLAY